jgi:TPR repeat protein
MKKQLIGLALVLSSTLWAGDFEDGMAAYEQQNYELAFTKFKGLADSGDAEAQFNLGVMYAEGKGVIKNDAEAVRWYELAADQGLAPAQSALGAAYGDGLGVVQNYTEAVRLFKLAADQGSAEAQYNLGLNYHEGWGVTTNYAEAKRWYKLAADQGYGLAQNNLGVMLAAKGRIDEARQAFEYALRNNPDYATAHENLGDILVHLAQRSYDNAIRLGGAVKSLKQKTKQILILLIK